jgi:hypothetical protein
MPHVLWCWVRRNLAVSTWFYSQAASYIVVTNQPLKTLCLKLIFWKTQRKDSFSSQQFLHVKRTQASPTKTSITYFLLFVELEDNKIKQSKTKQKKNKVMKIKGGLLGRLKGKGKREGIRGG